jgi:hypothetical protein
MDEIHKQEEALKAKVFDFLKDQPRFSNASLTVSYSTSDNWYIQYGDNLQSGIAGFGETPEASYEDFLHNWAYYKGEYWLEHHKHPRRFDEPIPFNKWVEAVEQLDRIQ